LAAPEPAPGTPKGFALTPTPTPGLAPKLVVPKEGVAPTPKVGFVVTPKGDKVLLGCPNPELKPVVPKLAVTPTPPKPALAPVPKPPPSTLLPPSVLVPPTPKGLAGAAEVPNGLAPPVAAKGFPPLGPKALVEGVPSPTVEPPNVPVGFEETPKGEAAKLETPGEEP